MRVVVLAIATWLTLVPQPATRTTLFKSADANEWLDAAVQHRPGADDAPRRKIASWSGGRLMRALAVVGQAPSSDELNSRLERAALLQSHERLEAAFVQILDEFRQRYLLSYTPTGVSKPGWHKIEVRVKTPRGERSRAPWLLRALKGAGCLVLGAWCLVLNTTALKDPTTAPST